MTTQPPTMAEAASAAAAAAATLLLPGLPDEIVLWEILARLDPKSLLRCRAVRRATSSRRFLLAHHARQPTLPIFSWNERGLGFRHHEILALDHWAATDAQLHSVARLDERFALEASCDGLLVLSKLCVTGSSPCLSICNPATREYAPLALGPLPDFKILGMYPHHPTGEYRLLLQRRSCRGSNLAAKDQIGCYVFSLGSNQPPSPRYIGCPKEALGLFNVPIPLCDSLHWYPVLYRSESNPLYKPESKLVIVFDTIPESFRQMPAPIVPTISTNSYLFKMGGTLGIHSESNCRLQKSGRSFKVVMTIVTWMLFRWMVTCSCCSILVGGYFMLLSGSRRLFCERFAFHRIYQES